MTTKKEHPRKGRKEKEMEENKSTEMTVEQPNPEPTQPEVEPKSEEKETKHTEEDIQRLMTELAKAKRERDKSSSEAAEYKKKWRESLSEVEAANMEKAEKEAAREEEFNRLKRENEINRLEKTYLAMGWTTDEASRMAVAEADNDFDSKMRVLSEAQERQKKEMEKTILASYGNVNVGATGSTSYTVEQFGKMSIAERSKLYSENREEYNRLVEATKK